MSLRRVVRFTLWMLPVQCGLSCCSLQQYKWSSFYHFIPQQLLLWAGFNMSIKAAWLKTAYCANLHVLYTSQPWEEAVFVKKHFPLKWNCRFNVPLSLYRKSRHAHIDATHSHAPLHAHTQQLPPYRSCVQSHAPFSLPLLRVTGSNI